MENGDIQVRKSRIKPAITQEGRENQLISLATDLAEKQLLEGTASAQVIVHYLRLATTRERIEKEILERQKELIVAKTENLKSTKRMEELYTEAMAVMKEYSGKDDEDV